MVTLQLWQLQKVPLRHHLHHDLLCQCMLFMRLGGQSKPHLSDLCFQPLPRPFYNKSIICFNKLRVNMCEKNYFLKALMPCRGRKIIIHPAGAFTKYRNRISKSCFHLELLWIHKPVLHFQGLFYFFAYVVVFKNSGKKKNTELMLFLWCFFLSRADILWRQ